MDSQALPLGAINVDVDTTCILLRAYGLEPGRCENATFSKVLPRMLGFFREHGIRATFFLPGSYAANPANRQIMQGMVSQGHELANHSYSHTPNFSSLSTGEKKEEIKMCQAAIEDAVGVRPLGFRAPGWDIDSDALKVLGSEGIEYDSSVMPSSFSGFIPVAMRLFGGGKTAWKSVGKKEYSKAPKAPYFPDPESVWKRGDSPVLELPISTSSPVAFPFYATAFFASSTALFSPAYAMLNQRSSYLNFQLHSVEFLSTGDVSGETMARLVHPAAKLALDSRLAFFRKSFATIMKHYSLITTLELSRHWRKKLSE